MIVALCVTQYTRCKNTFGGLLLQQCIYAEVKVLEEGAV